MTPEERITQLESQIEHLRQALRQCRERHEQFVQAIGNAIHEEPPETLRHLSFETKETGEYL